MPSLHVCFVCLGNICRSPTAEGIFRSLVGEAGLAEVIEIDSAGTGAWHVGDGPDPRSRETAAARGVRLGGSARQFEADDFRYFEYVLAMDRENREALWQLAPDRAARKRVCLLREFEPEASSERDVPDPYYGGPGGFDRVFDICDVACRGLLAQLRATHDLR